MGKKIDKRFMFKNDTLEEIIKDEKNRFFWSMQSLH
jgi:hypothetical protein